MPVPHTSTVNSEHLYDVYFACPGTQVVIYSVTSVGAHIISSCFCQVFLIPPDMSTYVTGRWLPEPWNVHPPPIPRLPEMSLYPANYFRWGIEDKIRLYEAALIHPENETRKRAGAMSQPVKGIGCSWRGPRFETQHPHTGSQPSVIPAPWASDTQLWRPWTLDMHTVHRIQTCRQETHLHKIQEKWILSVWAEVSLFSPKK